MLGPDNFTALPHLHVLFVRGDNDLHPVLDINFTVRQPHSQLYALHYYTKNYHYSVVP